VVLAEDESAVLQEFHERVLDSIGEESPSANSEAVGTD